MCFNEMKIKRNMDSLQQITIKTNPLVICYSFNSFMTERPLSYGNLSIDLQSKSMDWFLYDRNLRHKGVKSKHLENVKCHFFHFPSNRKLNPYSSNVPLPYPLKTYENLRFSDVFRGYKVEYWFNSGFNLVHNNFHITF